MWFLMRQVSGSILRVGWLVVAYAASGGVVVSAAELPSPMLPPPDPLRLASAPVGHHLGLLPEPGDWSLGAGVGWFNVWYAEGQAAALRRELGIGREVPFSDQERQELARRYPNQDLAHLDLEGTITELVLARGLAPGWAVSALLPVVGLGSPHWDQVPERWHDWFDLTQSNRDLFPRSRQALWIQGASGTVDERRPDSSGIGDLALALTYSAGEWLGAEHLVVGEVELPTGSKGTLRGSGGVDLGVRWIGRWEWSRSRLLVAAGYNRLDPEGELLGVERSDTWHGSLEYGLALGRRWAAAASVGYGSSPLADFTEGEPGEPVLTRGLGLSYRVGASTWVGLEYWADRGGMGIAPDVALRLVLSSAIGSD